MKLVKVAAAVINQTPRDWKGNYNNILAALQLAREADVSILCLPEATITGYGLEDDLFCADVPRRAMTKLKNIVSAPGPKSNFNHLADYLIFCVGLPIRFNNSLYNAVATVVNGRVI